jgi:hypothetical protein
MLAERGACKLDKATYDEVPTHRTMLSTKSGVAFSELLNKALTEHQLRLNLKTKLNRKRDPVKI